MGPLSSSLYKVRPRYFRRRVSTSWITWNAEALYITMKWYICALLALLSAKEVHAALGACSGYIQIGARP